jgi:predicted transcriptional regulator
MVQTEREYCSDHNKFVGEMSKASEKIKSSQVRLEAITSHLSSVTRSLDTFTGKIEPYLSSVEKMYEIILELQKEVIHQEGRTNTLIEKFIIYREEHDKTHIIIKWALALLCGSSGITSLVVVAKVMNWI